MPTPTHQKSLDKAKIALMTKPDSVFFCEVAFSFRYKWDESISTAAVDGKTVYLNPDFWMAQNKEQQIGLLLHETMHVVYMHLDRKADRDHTQWNIAGDHVINLMLLERGFKLPNGGLHDPQYRGMATEQVYNLLPKTPPSNFTPDILPPAEGMDAGELQAEVEQILVRAKIRSEQENDKPGTIPGDIEIFLQKLLKPKLPWEKLLRQWLNKFTQSDYSFKRPNRRFMPDHYLPSLYSIALADLAVAVDTSGSVSDKDFNRFVSEIAGIFRMVKPKRITLIQFDTKIHSVDEVRSFSDLMKVKFHGRGGTDIGEVIDWANQHKPDGLLMFTDGHFHLKNYNTKVPMLWLIHENPKFEAPYGRTIHYDIQ